MSLDILPRTVKYPIISQVYRSNKNCQGNGFKINIDMKRLLIALCVLLSVSGKGVLALTALVGANESVQFNRHIRPILSENCFACHGPDKAKRKSGLRLDKHSGATRDLGGYAAVVPGNSEASALVYRVTTDQANDRMPPAGKRLSLQQVELLQRWIDQGAHYTMHWSYVKPARPPLPVIQNAEWIRNPIDYFVLARLERERMFPSTEADRWTLARRVAIDLTGLPPTVEEAIRFVHDTEKDSYLRYVDLQLEKKTFGEHWARVWLDLARYADSAGYADDPPRTIWAYRDYVIRSLNSNKPFDQFTIEQMAGDLLDNPTEEQLIATAFHRNTQTNNEGGTNDEEFRNEAIVDRVNTTMAVWMGTTMACAQCHSHKYDPISQEEYFKFSAFFNNTQDSDKKDESPIIEIFTEEQKRERASWVAEIEQLKTVLDTPAEVLAKSQRQWEQLLQEQPEWYTMKPMNAVSSRIRLDIEPDDSIVATGDFPEQDTYTITLEPPIKRITALRLEGLPQSQNFVLSQVKSIWLPDIKKPVEAKYVRVELPGTGKILSLAEVQVFQDDVNVALKGKAVQSSTADEGVPERAVDGNTDGDYGKSESTTHTEQSQDPWWELDLGETKSVRSLAIWNRTDGGQSIAGRLAGFRLILLDKNRNAVWKQTPSQVPSPSAVYWSDGQAQLQFTDAFADYAQEGFPSASVLAGVSDTKTGWAVGGQLNQPHKLTLVLANPIRTDQGKILLRLLQKSQHKHLLIKNFRLLVTNAESVLEFVRMPNIIREIIGLSDKVRTDMENKKLASYYRSIAPELKSQRDRLAVLEHQIKEQSPYATVPIMRELVDEKRRETRIQFRGNFLDTGARVSEGIPAVFHPLSERIPANRLGLARWLVSRENPLTARVVVNRHWEQLFGLGIVSTSEEFGTQGELPTHPELMDWLAIELMDSGWNIKHLMKLIVTSATYRQVSKITPKALAYDPDNHLFARGPRFRLSAETVRDQALFVSGLLSQKMYGPPVNPPQPKLGINAAFGSGIDWETSSGEDRHRRGIYTMWRRSNPYPSMVTFDAPDRQVCTIRRPRSNTPLQALVTLNDPVYVEAAQSLGRKLLAHDGSSEDKIVAGLTCVLIRPAKSIEIQHLAQLYVLALTHYRSNLEQANLISTNPIGEPDQNADKSELAAWTVVSSVLLNLDEIFMKR